MMECSLNRLTLHHRHEHWTPSPVWTSEVVYLKPYYHKNEVSVCGNVTYHRTRL